VCSNLEVAFRHRTTEHHHHLSNTYATDNHHSQQLLGLQHDTLRRSHKYTNTAGVHSRFLSYPTWHTNSLGIERSRSSPARTEEERIELLNALCWDYCWYDLNFLNTLCNPRVFLGSNTASHVLYWATQPSFCARLMLYRGLMG
jgi:hypothetical protein